MAARALGVPLDALPVPVTFPRGIGIHPLRRLAVPMLLHYYRLRDSLG